MVELWSFEDLDAFDIWRLWWLSPRIRDAVDHLDLKRVLGVNWEQDARQAVRIIRETDWSSVSRWNRARMSLARNWSIGRCGMAGDYDWIIPHEWRLVSGNEAKRGRSELYGRATPFPHARSFRIRRRVDEQPRAFKRGSFTVQAARDIPVNQDPGTGGSSKSAKENGAVSAIGPNLAVPEVTSGYARSANAVQK